MWFVFVVIIFWIGMGSWLILAVDRGEFEDQIPGAVIKKSLIFNSGEDISTTILVLSLIVIIWPYVWYFMKVEMKK